MQVLLTKDWMIEMPFPKFQMSRQEFIDSFVTFLVAIMCVIFIGLMAMIGAGNYYESKYNGITTQWYGGYYPGEIYEIYDKNTGVYYGITDAGYAFPLYTINGELRLVDQGNEYVVHKNLGEPDAQE